MNLNRTGTDDDEWSDVSDVDSEDESDDDYEPVLDESVVDSDSDCNDTAESDMGSDTDPEEVDDIHPYIRLLTSYGKLQVIT